MFLLVEFRRSSFFVRSIMSLFLSLLSAYYMSSLEGIGEWMPWTCGENALACHVIFWFLSISIWFFFLWSDRSNDAWASCWSVFADRTNLRFFFSLDYCSPLILFLLGYSRNPTAPMSPRSYSAYSNAYGSSASSYGVPSPGFLNGKHWFDLSMSMLFVLFVIWCHACSFSLCV